MLATRIAPSFVCLRCEIRLANTLWQRPAAAAPLLATRHARIRRNGTQSAASIEEQLTRPSEEEEEGNDHHAEESGHARKPPPLRPRRHAFNNRGQQGKVYHSKGKRLFVEAEKLGVDILGKPAQAIVIKPRGNSRSRRQVIQEDAPAGQYPNGVWDAVELQESGPATPDEVQKNIAELRPAESSIVSEREFVALMDVLLDGFTIAQLTAYVSKNRGSDAEVLSSLGATGQDEQNPWVCYKWPWVPEVSADEKMGTAVQGYIKGNMSAKEKLVMRLVRECWGLSIREFMDGPGRLDVSVREAEFLLLLRSSKGPLEPISPTLIEAGKQVELVPSRRVVRIYAPRATAETILDEINGFLGKTVTRTTPLSRELRESGNFHEAALSAVSRITNTDTRLTPCGNGLQVSWTQLEPRDADLEDRADVVLRLLLTASKHRLQHASSLSVADAGSLSGCALVVEHGNEEKRMWADRASRWGRWVAPVKPPEDAVVKEKLPEDAAVRGRSPLTTELLKWGMEDSVSPSPLIQDTAEFLKISSGEEASPSTPGGGGWLPELKTSTTAVFGHVLHHQHMVPETPFQAVVQDYPGGPKRDRHPWDTARRRIVSPVVPPVVDGMPARNRIHHGHNAEIVMRFLPAPGSPAALLAPSLELRLACVQRKRGIGSSNSALYVSRVLSLRAVVASHAADVLLPHGRVDVRIAQTRYAELPGRAVYALPELAPLSTFLRRSRLDLLEGTLDTPARVPALAIPRGLLLPARYVESPPVQHGDADAAEFHVTQHDTVAVDYLFAGLEMRRAVSAPHGGFALTYTSIEAGQGGGRRAELSLDAWDAGQAVPPESEWWHRNEEDAEDGTDPVEAAEDLVKAEEEEKASRVEGERDPLGTESPVPPAETAEESQAEAKPDLLGTVRASRWADVNLPAVTDVVERSASEYVAAVERLARGKGGVRWVVDN